MDKIKSPEFKNNISQTIKVANNVASQLTNIEQKTVRSYNLNTANINDITTEVVDIIPSLYQNTIISSQEELGNKANPEQLASAFNTLLGENGSSKIANNAEDAANNNFIVSTNILTPYWTDKPLKFELQENGTYLISKINEDGTYTAMGFTTEETVNKYLQELDKVVNGFDNSEPSGHENDPRYDAPDDSSADSEPVISNGNETDDRYGPRVVPIEELTMKDIMLNKDAPDDSEPVVPKGNETADRYGPPDDSGADSEPVVPKGNETDDRYGPSVVPIEELTMKDIMLNKDAPDDSEPVVPKGS